MYIKIARFMHPNCKEIIFEILELLFWGMIIGLKLLEGKLGFRNKINLLLNIYIGILKGEG